MREVCPKQPKRIRNNLANVVVEKRWFTVAEAEKYIGFGGETKQREWRETGQLPYCLLGKQIVYDKADLDRFVQKHRVIQVNHLNR